MKRFNKLKLATLTLVVMLGLILPSCEVDWPDLPLPTREVYPPDGESSTISDTTNIVHFGEIDFTEYDELPAGSFPYRSEYFTSDNIPDTYLNEWVSKNFKHVTAGSTITLNYDYLDLNLPDSILYTRQTMTKFSVKDYKLKWGQVNFPAYILSTDINAEVNKVLNTKYGQIEPENPYRVVEYDYSDEEPTFEYNKPFTPYKEYFEVIEANYADNYWKAWTSEDHKPEGIIKALSGNIATFRPYTRSNHEVCGLFIRSRNTTGDSWFITPPIDLTNGVDPVLNFRIGFGYSAKGKENFKLMISTDFDGNEDNILDATWKDHREDANIVGTDFKISDISHSTSYAVTSSMKMMEVDLSEYAEYDKVYIGFRDNPGPEPEDPAALPFTVIDQISVNSVGDFASVPESSIEPKIELYEKVGENWTKLTEGYYILDKSDYDSLGTPYLEENEAIEKIAAILATRINNANENDIYCVIYKNSNLSVSNYNYRLEGGEWKVMGLDVERESTTFELEYPYNWKIVND